MEEQQIKKLIKKYLSDTIEKEGLIYSNRMLILPSKEPLLRAILFDKSINKEAVICWWFVQPLFIRLDFKDLSIGERFTTWYDLLPTKESEVFSTLKSEIIKNIPNLKYFKDINSTVNYIKNKLTKDHVNEITLFYCAIWLKNKNIASKYLSQISVWKEIRRGIKIDGVAEMKKETQHLYEVFLKNPEEAREILKKNIAYTIKALKLPKEVFIE